MLIKQTDAVDCGGSLASRPTPPNAVAGGANASEKRQTQQTHSGHGRRRDQTRGQQGARLANQTPGDVTKHLIDLPDGTVSRAERLLRPQRGWGTGVFRATFPPPSRPARLGAAYARAAKEIG